MAKKYFWFKMQEDFFRSKEVKKLRKIAGGDTYTIIYQKMILLSIRTQGKIFFDGVEDSFAEEIALEIDEDVDNVKVTLNYAINNKMVDVMSESEIVMTEAIKHIGTQDESTERVRLHRERKKQQLLPLHVTNETTEIEVDKEKEREKDYYIVNDDKIHWFEECYYGHTGNKYRHTKKIIDWHLMLCDITKEDFIDLVYKFFEDDKIKGNNVTIEYFNTVVDRYR